MLLGRMPPKTPNAAEPLTCGSAVATADLLRYSALGVFGTTFRALDWKPPIAAGRMVPKNPKTSKRTAVLLVRPTAGAGRTMFESIVSTWSQASRT